MTQSAAATRPRLRTKLPDCPYVGLTPFTEADEPFFFGREAERQILLANLMAARLTLVYGPSGVGKSSLLHAGIAPDLRAAVKTSVEAGRLPESIGIVFASWRDDPLAELTESLAAAIASQLGDLAPEAVPPQRTLVELLELWTDRLDEQARALEDETQLRQPPHVQLLLVLDQFEEYFLYHGDESGAGTLAADFPAAVNRRGLRANFLVSIRDDAYTQLDFFEPEIPNLFANNIRIEHLGKDAAEEAIRGPVRRYEEFAGPAAACGVEDALVAAVLEQVRTGSVVLGQTGGGGVVKQDEGEPDLRIETPFLQLVMERIWHEEQERGSPLLRLETLTGLGGAERIVQTHVERAVAALDRDGQEVAARTFGRLVTPSGTKIAYFPSELAEVESLPLEQLGPVLEELSRVRILRTVVAQGPEKEPRYEIFHDVLAPAVLEWRAGWLQAQKTAKAAQEHEAAQRALAADLERQEQERRAAEAHALAEQKLAQRFRVIAFVVGVLGIGAVALAAWAYVERQNTIRATQRADISELRRQMATAFVGDPSRAMVLAEQAVLAQDKSARRGWAVNALRRGLQEANLIASLDGRAGAVRTAAFSRDGKRIITAAGHAIDIWNGTNGEHLMRLPLDKAVLGAALDPTRTSVVSGDAGGNVRLWDVPTGESRVLIHVRAPILLVSFSRDGKRVLAANSRGRVYVLDRRTAALIGSIDAQTTPTVAAFNPSGALVLVANVTGGAGIWSAKGRQIRLLGGKLAPPPGAQTVRASQSPIRAAAFSSDGKFIVTGNNDGAVRVWKTPTRRRAKAAKAIASHTIGTAVTSIAFNHGTGSRMRVVAGSADGSAKVWRATARRALTVLRGHTDQIGAVAFSLDDRQIVTASDDRTAAVWDSVSGVRQSLLAGHRDSVALAAFSQDGKRILTAGAGGTTRLWRAPAPQAADREFRLNLGDVYSAAFSPHGAHVLIAGSDGFAIIPPTGKTIQPKAADDYPFATFNSRGTRILTVGPTKRAVWSAESGERLSLGRDRTSTWPKASADGSWVVLTDGKTLRLWDTLDQAPLAQVFRVRGGRIAAVEISSNGRYFAAQTDRGRITVWDASTLLPIGKGISTGISQFGGGPFAISPDGQEIVSAASAGAATDVASLTRRGTQTIVWATRSGKPRFALRTQDSASILQFSPRGNLIVTAGDGNTVRVWSARTGTRIAKLVGHTGPIRAAGFSPNGRLVVTASDDGTARVWVARSGELLAVFGQGHSGDAEQAAFDARGERVVVAGSHGSTAIYSCLVCGNVDALLARAKYLEPRRTHP